MRPPPPPPPRVKLPFPPLAVIAPAPLIVPVVIQMLPPDPPPAGALFNPDDEMRPFRTRSRETINRITPPPIPPPELKLVLVPPPFWPIVPGAVCEFNWPPSETPPSPLVIELPP